MADIKVVMMAGRWTACVDELSAVSSSVEVVAAETDGDLMREIKNAVVVYGRLPREPFLDAGRLKWVQSVGVGFETMLYPEMIESDVIITNTAGAFDPAMAEHALALMLGFTRGVIWAERRRKDRGWSRDTNLMQIFGRRACVLGLGTIGKNISIRLHALGMHVIAVDAQVKAPPEGVDELVGPDGLLDAVGKADFVIVALPLTDRTRGLVNADCFDRMSERSYLINVARGPIVNETDLIEALKDDKIAGAGLDVFETEPLPDSSPLWDMPNVIMTPHLAGGSAEGRQNVLDIFRENLRRYVKGDPLLNVVDKKKGYVIQEGG